jgi:hypothetical protein
MAQRCPSQDDLVGTTGLIIDGKVISQGKVLAPIEIEAYLSK